jgi:hypothetical protein
MPGPAGLSNPVAVWPSGKPLRPPRRTADNFRGEKRFICRKSQVAGRRLEHQSFATNLTNGSAMRDSVAVET